MSYSPCREDYLQALYIVRKHARGLLACFKRFLKAFINYTAIHEDSYLKYRR
jgi:hypothetical protein